MNIWWGSGENKEFSNLALRPFSYHGESYVSVEHAYQVLKSGNACETTFYKPWREGVKYIGLAKADTRDNWNIELMRRLVQESFRQNPLIYKRLFLTGNVAITHKQDRGIWREEFPKILEEVRANYKEEL